MFLEECKYVINEKKIPRYIIDDTEVSSDSNEENSDEGTLLKKFRWRKILIMKKILMRKFWEKNQIEKYSDEWQKFWWRKLNKYF